MFCPSCGNKLADGAKFCPKCGASVSGQAASNSENPATAQTQAQAAPASSTPLPTDPKPRRRKAPLVVALVAVVVLAACGVLLAMHFLGKGASEGEQQATNSAVSYNTTVSTSEYDYFYSSRAGGICRAKPDGSSVEVIYPIDNMKDTVDKLALDGDTLLFIKTAYFDMSGAAELHTIKTDGTGDAVIYTMEPNEDGNGGWGGIDQVSIFDHRVYLVTSTNAGGVDKLSFDVISLNIDGSDQKMLAHVSGMTGDGVLVTPDKIYYSTTPYGASTEDGLGSIMSLDIDGTNLQELYKSDFGTTWELSLAGGRLCFREMDSTSGQIRVNTLALDGSDFKVIYQPDATTWAGIEATSPDYVFLETYDQTDPNNMPDISDYDIVRVPLDGGEPQTIAESLNLYNPTFSNVGGRLLAMENGQYPGSVGERVMTISYDGSQKTEYPLG